MAEVILIGSFKKFPDLQENETERNTLTEKLFQDVSSQPLFKLEAFAVSFEKATPRKVRVGAEFVSAENHVRVEILPGEIIHKAMLGKILDRILGEEKVDITYLQVEVYLGEDRLESVK